MSVSVCGLRTLWNPKTPSSRHSELFTLNANFTNENHNWQTHFRIVNTQLNVCALHIPRTVKDESIITMESFYVCMHKCLANIRARKRGGERQRSVQWTTPSPMAGGRGRADRGCERTFRLNSPISVCTVWRRKSFTTPKHFIDSSGRFSELQLTLIWIGIECE